MQLQKGGSWPVTKRGWGVGVVKGAVFLRPQDLSLTSSVPNSKEGVLSQHNLLTRLMVCVGRTLGEVTNQGFKSWITGT